MNTINEMTMTGKSPLITLNNGVKMPAFGLGVYLSRPEESAAAVLWLCSPGAGFAVGQALVVGGGYTAR